MASLADISGVFEVPQRATRHGKNVREITREVPRALLGAPKPLRLLRYAATEWVMIAALWMAMSRTPTWLYPLWCLLLAGRFHALGVLVHDASHMARSLWRSRGVSRWAMYAVELLAAYPLGTSIRAMRYHHNRHHRNTNLPSDPYFKPTLEGRPLLYGAYWVRFMILPFFWFARAPYGVAALLFPRLQYSYARVFLQDPNPRRLSSEIAACNRDDLGVLVFFAVVLAFSVMFPNAAMSGFVIPAVVTGLAVGYRFLHEHTYRPITSRRLETMLTVTRDHTVGLLGRVLLSPRNVGYHAIHHLHPTVGLEHLPALRAWYDENYPGLLPPVE